MISRISNFDAVLSSIQPGTHVFCDIDDTVLKMDPNKKIVDDESLCDIDAMCPTDYHGFHRLYSLVNSKTISGKISFLTARHEKHDLITRFQLSSLAIPTRQTALDIYYTNNLMSKGDFMHKYLRGYVNSGVPIVFIDDRPAEAFSVWSQFPNIKCYIYTYPTTSDKKV